jgi:hypothetical protein
MWPVGDCCLGNWNQKAKVCKLSLPASRMALPFSPSFVVSSHVVRRHSEPPCLQRERRNIKARGTPREIHISTGTSMRTPFSILLRDLAVIVLGRRARAISEEHSSCRRAGGASPDRCGATTGVLRPHQSRVSCAIERICPRGGLKGVTCLETEFPVRLGALWCHHHSTRAAH